MASWRDSLRPASFKNIKFEVDGSSSESGRRGQTHEYPNRDIPYFEDMGKKAETFTFEAFVIGDDYMARRDALIKACNSDGAGTLVHPTRGNIQCHCTGCSISERQSEGRMARFSLTFTEAGTPAISAAVIDFQDAVSSAADIVEKASIDNFAERFSIDGKPTSITQSISDVAKNFASKALQALRVVNSKLTNATSIFDIGIDAIDAVTAIALQMGEIYDNALNALKKPDVFAAKVSACMAIVNSYLAPKEATRQTKLLTALGVAADVARMSTETPKGADQVEMMEQIELMTQRVGLAYQAKTIASIGIADQDSSNSGTSSANQNTGGSTNQSSIGNAAYSGGSINGTTAAVFTSAEEAQEVLNEFVAQIEAQILIEVPTDDEVMTSLKDLQAAVAAYISDVMKRLPESRTIVLAENTPSVVLAYDQYEDIYRAPEIVSRNNIRNPSFMPAGRDIEVLSS